MGGLTPTELFDTLEQAIADTGAGRRWWHGQNRVAVWFTTPTVQIGDREWTAVHDGGPRRHGYTLRQARQMRDALLPILAAYTEHVAAAARRLQPHIPEETR